MDKLKQGDVYYHPITNELLVFDIMLSMPFWRYSERTFTLKGYHVEDLVEIGRL